MLRGFTGRILDFQPDSWTTHVAGHPPGAFLRLRRPRPDRPRRRRLGGDRSASLVGALIAVARAASPSGRSATRPRRGPPSRSLVLFPGAVWIGVSADGLFAGVTATGLALLAIGLTRRNRAAAHRRRRAARLRRLPLLRACPARRARRWPWCSCAGRSAGPLGAALVGAAVVVAAFTVAGFWWLDGYHLVIERYYQGIAERPPVRVLGLGQPRARRRLRRPGRRRDPAPCRRRARPAGARPCCCRPPALLAILAADLSGYSKAEVERIWLPFAVWLMAGAALLPAPGRRVWLVAQAAVALLVNHLLLTTW